MRRFYKQIKHYMNLDCHIWSGTISRNYGYFEHRGAHRVAWELANKRPVPKGMWVLHKCDCPSCVNPAHLYLGTAKDNSRDMVVRNRARTKLTQKQVAEILKFPPHADYRRYLAKLYGVTVPTITAVQNGRTWRHFTPTSI